MAAKMSALLPQIGKQEDSECRTLAIDAKGSDTSEEAEDDFQFQDINMLVDHGVSVDDVRKVRQLGINTMKGLLMVATAKLKGAGFSDEKIRLMRSASGTVSSTSAFGFVTADEMAREMSRMFKVSTGSPAFDQLLGGGIEAMTITEVFGEAGSGKTQIAHTLCVTAQMPGSNGYTGGKVVYIDTEHTFRPNRVKSIADRFNMDKTLVLNNVICARAYNSEQQLELVNQVPSLLHQENGFVKLLIVDSIMSLFRVDYDVRNDMITRQKKVAEMMSKLQRMSEEYNIAVFITNQVTSDFSNNEPIKYKPFGGHVLSHALTTRIHLSKSSGALRKVEIHDSPSLEKNETEFIITAGGIDDINT